jgi:RNA polymerase sigma-70 factor (ECF subfamily)
LQQQSKIEILVGKISQFSDQKAFKQFFDLYANRLFEFAFSFLKSKQLAEEAVADVFFKVWLNRETLPSIENIKAYLFKATYNTTLNYLDEEKRRKAIGLNDIKVDLGVDHICPETELMTKELKGQIDQAIESLPPRCKLIYKLAKVEQMKYKEIASLLDISVKTIDHQLSIAIKKIGEKIREYLSRDGNNSNFLVLMQLFIPLK